MSKAPDKELVPDTPSGTAEQFVDQTDSTVGESLLQHFLHDPNLSPTLNKTEDSHTNSKDGTTQSSSDSSNSSKSYPSQNSQLDQQAGTREGAKELEEGSAIQGVAGTRRKQRTTSQEGRASESDPAEGPGGSGQVEEGFLGAQTQAQSLDTSWDKRRRLSDNRMRAKIAEEEENLFANGEESVEEGRESVEQSAGVMNNDSRSDEEADQLESSEAEVGGGSNNRESQKENASSSRPPVSSTSSAPLALRNSHVNLEPSASAPSSSPAVAQQLLQRSPRKKAFAPIPETASSTDPTPSLGHLLTRRHIPQPETNSSPDKGDISDLTFSGPGTSTPAFALAHAPAPAPTQAETRSIPPFRLVEKRASEPSANPSPVRSRSLRQSNTTPALPPDPALFASSAALAKPAPKRKKTRDEWDGISQDTPEEIRMKKKGKKEEVEVEVEPEESVPLSPTQIHEDEEEDLDVSMDVEERDPTPKPTAERTVDMDLDEGDSHSYSIAVEDHGGGTLDTSTVNADDSYQRRSLSPRPTASEDPLNESLSDQAPPRNQVTLPLFAPVASSSSASSSPMTSQDHHARFDSSAQEQEAKSKRLSDISEMRSSQELPPTQYEVEATQKVYDVEKSQMSIGSVDMDITNSATWHAPFAHDESTSTSHSRQRSNPVPGRELRRIPPPPTPAVDPNPPRASSPLKQSFHLEESTQPADESSPAPNLPQTSSSNQPQPTSEDSLALPVPPLHHANPATQPVQPTQEVAESSPDIPLSKRARLQKGASEATSRSSLRRPTPSPSRQQQTTQSSNGKVVPDSEGPTQQDHEEEEEEERQPVASTSARIDESDSEGELESLTSLEDMLKASKRKSQARSEQNEEEVEKPKKDRKGKGKAKEQEEEGGAKRKEKLKQMRDRVLEHEEAEEEEVSREEKKSKGKGKAKLAVKEKGGGSKGKGKGKKKVVEVESESEMSSPGEGEETNYSDMPKARNSKKLSPKKKAKAVVVVDNSSAKKPRRKASGPTIIERSDDEEMEEEEEERQNRPAKPATSKRKRQPSPSNADVSNTSKRSKRSVSTGAGTSSKKVVVSKGRRSTTGSSRATVASESPGPDPPVAGPSRLRFDLAPEDDARTETSDTKPSIGSKLPPSAPFSRCFGLWRDDGYYYSGTIESVSREHFNVKFDDGNTGKLRSNEIRRCELEKGDYVLYFPDDTETETQAESYVGEFRVAKIDRNGREGGEEEGQEGRPLEARDVAIVKEAANFGDNSSQNQRFLVEAIRISPLRSHQFNNRKLTPDEIDAFEGKVRSNAKPLPVIPPPTRPDISAFEDNDKKNWGLFGRIAFLVTYASSKSPSEPNVKELKPVDRERFLDKLKDNGATIIDWEHLFESGIDKRTKKPQVSFPPTDFNGIDTILLLADRPTTTMKFLIALALGIPCCSLEFAGASIKAGTRLDWRDWLLPSGYIQSMKTAGIGGQLRALLKSSYDLSSLERSQQGEGVFKNQSFLVIMEKQGKSREEKLSFNRHAYMLLSLLSCCSSTRIDSLPLPLPSSSPFVQSPSEFLNSAQSYTHVFLDFDPGNSAMEGAVKGLVNGHKGIVNMNWIKQCLMAGRLLPSERIKLQD